MKSYTDIEQSERLAEILPLESADMQWLIDDLGLGEPFPFPVKDRVNENEKPCWSLAALVELLPNGSRLNKSSNGKYFCSGVLYDNPIDACVGEIELLVETRNWKFNKEE